MSECNITGRQLLILADALGLSVGEMVPRRNAFVARDGDVFFQDVMKLVDIGLMFKAKSPSFFHKSQTLFKVTEKGINIATGGVPPAPTKNKGKKRGRE